MAKRMLIDATHSEETRVAVIDGNRLVEFDYESKVRKQLKGSIFLAKVTRVEPSLQAAFVNFGGNRHGFLPFAEIHPDYFRIPIADREALIAEQKAMLERLAAEEEAAIAAEEAALAAMEQAKAATDSPFVVSDDASQDVQSAEDIITNEAGGSVETIDQEFVEPVLLNQDQEFSSDEDEDDDSDDDDSDDEDEDDDDDDSEELSEQQEHHHNHGDHCDHHHDQSSQDDSDQSEQNGENSESENNDEEQQPSAVWIYRGVTSYDESTGKFEATEDGEIKHFTAETAAKLKALCEAYADIVRIRTDVQTAEDGTETTIVWLAYKADNQAMLEQEGDGRRGRGRYGRRYRGRGRGRNGRDRDQGVQASEQNTGEDGAQAGDEPAPREANNNNNRGSKGRRDGRGDGRRDGRGGGRGRQPFRSRRVEMLGGDTADGDQPFRFNLRRNYKIQEVIKRGQIMLIQVQKEERGNKGAAVTTYLSLPGRFSVLMPNSPRGGGVSRKIASFAERKRMREILSELNVPEGMSVILRTAGTSREKDEIKRDLDYLMRMWDKTRELTLESSAPSMIYEESSLVKRAVRDIHTSDIEEILVAGAQAYTESKNFMDMLMPTHVDRVKHYDDEKIPLFHRYQVENQIAEIGEPVVQLRSGGYLVINPTEALVSVDVNSGRATKERHIEETALKTNLEAADEVARQLRLRDLGGLVVIDFIDMEDYRNNAKVERRLREALSSDRARIQVGRISSFGLLELSRQRLNPSLTEAQFEKCPHCLGVGNIRSVDSASILALRALEEEGIRSRAGQVYLSVPSAVALYILNNMRDRLVDIERRYGFRVFVRADDSLARTGVNLEAVKAEIDVDANDSDDDRGDDAYIDAGENQQQPQRQNRDRGERNDRQDRGNNRRGGRGRNERGNRNAQDDQETNNVEELLQPQQAVEPKPAAEKSQAPSSGFRAKRFSSRKTTDATAQTPSVTQTANDSEPQQSSSAHTNSVSEDSEGARKKGWWNRLID